MLRIALGLEYDGSRFLGWQTQPADRIGRKPHRSGDRRRTGVEAGSGTYAITGQPCADIGGAEAERANQHREQRLRYSVLRDAPDELRSNAIADGEKEHQEKRRFQRPRNRNANLADDHGGNERRGDRAKAQASVEE